ncbi:MAG: Zn-dependent oligopeptidase [Methanospirillum sp.]|nr:Zn-dependent oligopeptidase [Methanospirillum sp.]
MKTHFELGEITERYNQAVLKANQSLNEIGETDPDDRTVNNTLVRFDQIISEFNDAVLPLVLMGYIYPDTGIAGEGMEAEQKKISFLFNVSTRRDLYDAFRSVKPATPEESRLSEVTLRKYEKNGLLLPDDQIAGVRMLRENLTKVESEYSANLNNDNTTLLFTADELKGVPEETLKTFSLTDNGTYLVTMKYPDYNPVMKYAVQEDTRRRMMTASKNIQAANNTRLLEEAIQIRQQIAEKLGYDSWAAYQIDGRMAGSPGNVTKFLDSLEIPLHSKALEEEAVLLRFKENEDPRATRLEPWDISYYTEKLKEQGYSVNDEEISEYFPLERVLSVMFSWYGALFGIRLEEVEEADVWSPDVTLYRIVNTSDGRLIAYLYCDLFPRDGKYRHMATFALNYPRERDNGSYVVPITTIVGNFPKPAEEKPSLLPFNEVETLFHEFGHTLHESLSTAPYGTLSGIDNVELDFTETPSQAMEEWIWDPEVIDQLSGHYTNQSGKLPADMRDNLIASRDIDIGTTYAGQLVYAKEDMEFNTRPGPVNVIGISDSLYKEILGIDPVQGGHEPASIPHFAGGYDAGYYSYLWSKIYAINLFSRFEETGIGNSTTGMNYRHWILEPGNMQDGRDLLRGFLGKEPGQEAFLQRLRNSTSDT